MHTGVLKYEHESCEASFYFFFFFLQAICRKWPSYPTLDVHRKPQNSLRKRAAISHTNGSAFLQALQQAKGIAYDDCYAEDRDNYIDIILTGDLLAARSLTFVEIPSLEGGYRAFYNPGGPGPQPFEGVIYSAPGPADMEPIIMALDDPMRVSRMN